MMHKFKHSISIYSPLNLHEDKGYALLNTIKKYSKADINAGIFEFEIPEKECFKSYRFYNSAFIKDCKTLSSILYDDKLSPNLVFTKAWKAVSNMALDLYQVAKKIPPRNYPLWLNLDKYSHEIIYKIDNLHCLRCKLFVQSLFSHKSLSDLSKKDKTPLTWCHGDLHASNLVFYKNNFFVIDLENLHPAPIYTDFFLFFLLNHSSAHFLIQCIENFANVNLKKTDFISSILHALKIFVILYDRANEYDRDLLGKSLHNFISLCNKFKFNFGLHNIHSQQIKD